MWFTKVSLQNPVFATMVMAAFVVLGLFSLQRLKAAGFEEQKVGRRFSGQ